MIKKIESLEDYKDQYQKSVESPEQFWSEIANTFSWRKTWDRVVDWDFKELDVKWFSGARLNITENCLDRHLDINGDKIAIIWEPNDPKESTIKYSYEELHQEVCRFANVLRRNGAKKGIPFVFICPWFRSWR